MNYSEILTLLDKGFTPDQIMTLTGSAVTAPPEDGGKEVKPSEDSGKDVKTPEEEPETGVETKPEDQSNSQTGLVEEVNGVITQLKELRSQMDSMRKVFQKEAIQNDSINTPTQVSAEEALAELIRPKYTNTK